MAGTAGVFYGRGDDARHGAMAPTGAMGYDTMGAVGAVGAVDHGYAAHGMPNGHADGPHEGHSPEGSTLAKETQAGYPRTRGGQSVDRLAGFGQAANQPHAPYGEDADGQPRHEVQELQEAIDFSLVYALHTFIANLEGQVCVMKGDALLLLDDANAYWWLVKCIKTEEIGYIPAENVETPYERLARLNRQRNVLATALPEHLPLDDYTDATHGGVSLAADMDEGRLVRFATMHTEICEITSGEASSDDGDGDARAADGGHAKHGSSKHRRLGSGSSSGSRASRASRARAASSESGMLRSSGSVRTPGQLFSKLLGRREPSGAASALASASTAVLAPSTSAAHPFAATSGSPSSSHGLAEPGATPAPLRHSRFASSAATSSLGSVVSSAPSSRHPSASDVLGIGAPSQRSLAPSSEPTSTDPAAVADGAAPATPRNVLRVYAGNIDLKATFKSVEIRDDMTVGELLATAVKRFRVTNAANEYYLSVLHMDSQEKPLSEDQNIMVVLQTLRSKGLPGVSAAAPTMIERAVGSGGHVSSVCRIDSDQIIRVIINKKLNHFEKDFHLARIFRYENDNPTLRTYKTAGVRSDARIRDLIEIAFKKFKIDAAEAQQSHYTLHSIFRNEERRCDPDALVVSVLGLGGKSPEDVHFVLRHASADPLDPTAASEAAARRRTSMVLNINKPLAQLPPEAMAAVSRDDSAAPDPCAHATPPPAAQPTSGQPSPLSQPTPPRPYPLVPMLSYPTSPAQPLDADDMMRGFHASAPTPPTPPPKTMAMVMGELQRLMDIKPDFLDEPAATVAAGLDIAGDAGDAGEMASYSSDAPPHAAGSPLSQAGRGLPHATSYDDSELRAILGEDDDDDDDDDDDLMLKTTVGGGRSGGRPAQNPSGGSGSERSTGRATASTRSDASRPPPPPPLPHDPAYLCDKDLPIIPQQRLFRTSQTDSAGSAATDSSGPTVAPSAFALARSGAAAAAAMAATTHLPLAPAPVAVAAPVPHPRATDALPMGLSLGSDLAAARAQAHAEARAASRALQSVALGPGAAAPRADGERDGDGMDGGAGDGGTSPSAGLSAEARARVTEAVYGALAADLDRMLVSAVKLFGPPASGLSSLDPVAAASPPTAPTAGGNSIPGAWGADRHAP